MKNPVDFPDVIEENPELNFEKAQQLGNEVRRKTVFVPQEPSRFDSAQGVWLPTVNLRPAAIYGDLKVMFPPNISGLMMAPILTGLREQLRASQADDYLIAVGDPAIIAAASGIWLRKHSRLNLLVWDRVLKQYNVSEIEL